MMHNFGYSKSTTADETVIVDCYCFVIAICSHHLVMSLALTPVVVLGWDSAGSVGQFLFYAGAVGDLAYSTYDSVQITLRAFFPVSFKGHRVQRVYMGVPSALCDDGVPRTRRPAVPLPWASGLRSDDPVQPADGDRLDQSSGQVVAQAVAQAKPCYEASVPRERAEGQAACGGLQGSAGGEGG
eukprot:CAMPEP_0181541056 /NCGR_PEP_ID=MMETSP1110-20121109/77208_1 /TAXON_ID=174948 /ORGANISM="Symbiodinium sp., Strain CCMP421" /LENGTH=183 /DNA_ID=CAMNT_0023672723 /DNA_START=106 /DNA_END=653 /DNA_ORIENTATION=+